MNYNVTAYVKISLAINTEETEEKNPNELAKALVNDIIIENSKDLFEDIKIDSVIKTK